MLQRCVKRPVLRIFGKRLFRTYDYDHSGNEFNRTERTELRRYGVSMGTYSRTARSTGKRHWGKLLAVILGIAFWKANSREIPFSKRVQFIGLPDWVDEIIGSLAYHSQECEVYHSDHPYSQRVVYIVNGILSILQEQAETHQYLKTCIKWDWTVCVVRDNSLNASCAPSGKIIVHDSLIREMSVVGLYFVLSHEIGHAIARHGIEKELASAVANFFMSFFRKKDTNGVVVDLLDCSSSQKAESEADEIAFHIMRASDFPTGPEVLEHVFVTLNDFNDLKPVEDLSFLHSVLVALSDIFSTHPTLHNRFLDLSSLHESTPVPEPLQSPLRQPLRPVVYMAPDSCSEEMLITPFIAD
eukprot:TRINITY_DN17532_c1_g4_i1.p1 TRINITY_DN17532_c1_g4~~TRINITY_DN17532_c1_g4_i1.p1  ORF type:complete len:365 (+),score=27.14 TRINITY_DN17532_c1_g4_i1:30-1097(+)